MSLKDLITADVDNVFVQADEFAENVIVHASDGDRNLMAIVEIDEPIRDDNGYSPTLYVGKVRIKSGQRAAFISESNAALTATIRGFVWDITDIGEADFSMCNVGIRREIPEHSNAIDLEGNQHRYA